MSYMQSFLRESSAYANSIRTFLFSLWPWNKLEVRQSPSAFTAQFTEETAAEKINQLHVEANVMKWKQTAELQKEKPIKDTALFKERLWKDLFRDNSRKRRSP